MQTQTMEMFQIDHIQCKHHHNMQVIKMVHRMIYGINNNSKWVRKTGKSRKIFSNFEWKKKIKGRDISAKVKKSLREGPCLSEVNFHRPNVKLENL